MYEIAYKHAEHGSDTIGCNYRTIAAALRAIAQIHSDPSQIGLCDWLRDASLWVVDGEGRIVAEQ